MIFINTSEYKSETTRNKFILFFAMAFGWFFALIWALIPDSDKRDDEFAENDDVELVDTGEDW